MLFAKKKMQVRIQAGIPFHPAVFPVWPCKIAGIFAQDLDRFRAIFLRLCIEDKFSTAMRLRRCFLAGHLGDRFPGSVWARHWTDGRDAK